MRWLTLLFALLVSCNQWSGDDGGCIDDGDCEGISVCHAETATCLAVDCTDSSHCALGAHCAAEINTCVTGCGEDSDCLAGQTCNGVGQCEVYGCRDTELDCRYGENCNASTGQCVDDPDPHCMLANDFTPQFECSFTYGGVLGCWGEIDTNGYCIGDIYCLLPCNAGPDSCPRGTSCIAPFQNDPATYCYGDCPYLLDNGF